MAVPQDAKEVWFTGSHGDVGGGYPEAESALAKIPLDWMISEAETAGLFFKTRTVNRIVQGGDERAPYVKPDAAALAHDSMNWGWTIAECLPRRKPANSKMRSFLGLSIPFFEKRPIPEGAMVHASVRERSVQWGDSPANLPKHGEYEV